MRYTLLVLVAALSATGCTLREQSLVSNQGRDRVSITQSAKKYLTQNIPSQIAVLHVVSDKPTEQDVVANGAKFGVFGAPEKKGRDYILHNGDLWFSEDDTTGIQMFCNTSKMWGANRQAAKGDDKSFATAPRSIVPDDITARNVALNYIVDHGLAGSETPVYYQTNDLFQSISTSNESYLVQREIVFKRAIDGVLIHGNGSQISVFLGDKGEVVGAMVDWPKLAHGKPNAIKNGDQALLEVPRKVAELNTQTSISKQIQNLDLTKVAFGYVGQINQDGSRDLVPTYVALGKAHTGDGEKSLLMFLTAADKAPVKKADNRSDALHVITPPLTQSIDNRQP